MESANLMRLLACRPSQTCAPGCDGYGCENWNDPSSFGNTVQATDDVGKYSRSRFPYAFFPFFQLATICFTRMLHDMIDDDSMIDD
jgi:hypothetical protein